MVALRQELLDEIRQLSTEQQLALVEEINRELRQKARVEAAERLEGLLGHTRDEPTTDQIKEDYAAYLEEKYR